MTRKALIIYCNNTQSGELQATQDFYNYHNFLTSYIGGHWHDYEIFSLQNPTIKEVKNKIASLSDADYTFVVFSGHGFTNKDDNMFYMELDDDTDSLCINDLLTGSKRQLIIIDACRTILDYGQSFRSVPRIGDEPLIGDPGASTRQLFDYSLSKAEEGVIVLYSCDIDESSIDTRNGGAYSYCLLNLAFLWLFTDKAYNIMPVDTIHLATQNFISEWAESTHSEAQNPRIINYSPNNRTMFFPFAVKHTY